MTDQEKNIKGIIKNSSNKQSNAPVVKEELIGRYDRKKTISLIRYVLQKMEDKNTPFVPLHYTLIALYNSLALLSDLEPRVMTLEEVKNIKTFERVWLEIRLMENIHHVQILQFDDCPAFEQISSMPVRANWDDYGKIWILWTNEPTNEQREAVPWQ